MNGHDQAESSGSNLLAPAPAQPDPSELCRLDLVGGPFAVIESDPGVFTSLTRKLGIKGLELVEMYDIEPWAVDHLNPRGLIFCFLWRKDTHRPADFEDPAAERVWFANQLIDDACASHAILNVVLNCPDVELGEELSAFKRDTESMSAVMKGLAISNSPLMRQAHNSLARPADIRGALNAIAITTLEAQKAKPKPKARDTNPPPAKRRKANVSTSNPPSPRKKAKRIEEEEEDGGEETYHFIGYVPAFGKVWELDGLKSGPLEVGELPTATDTKAWMSVVRPALRMKMQRYGGAAEGGSNIRFSLLALVDGLYERASDQLELLKRERGALERRLDTIDQEWKDKVNPTLRSTADDVFATSVAMSSSQPGKTFARDFGARKMERQVEILDMPERSLVGAWEACVQNAMPVKIGIEDEIAKSVQANTDHIKRTHDYEPFLREFVTRLHNEGLLDALLDREDEGKKKGEGGKKGKASG